MPRLVKSNDPKLKGLNIRLISSSNEQLGIVTFQQAISLAEEEGRDLVSVADRAEPPVCRIMNFGKFMYEKRKRDRDQRKKNTAQRNKEVKFRANIDTHDYQIKLNRIIEFLHKGFRVKVTLFFRGREMAHRDLGMDVLKRVITDVDGVGIVDLRPRMTGRILNMQLTPVQQK